MTVTCPNLFTVSKRYDAALFPKFESVFDQVPDQGAFSLLAQPPHEAAGAVVMENCTDKDVTAFSYGRLMTDQDGKVRNALFHASTMQHSTFRQHDHHSSGTAVCSQTHFAEYHP
jgi:hypothetical protein